MKRVAIAIAHPNIALAKYWGKRKGGGNVPAVPSLSVTLEGLSTTTTVTFDDEAVSDSLVLNGQPCSGAPLQRATELLDRVRARAAMTSRAEIVTVNDFPTASGLASSASGFAALALASVRAAGLDLDSQSVAQMARESSASAARSLFGGFVELDGEIVRTVAPRDALSMRIVVAVTTEAAKPVSSTKGMLATETESPFYGAWLEEAPVIFSALRAALIEGDFVRVGEWAERSALAMHGCIMGGGLVYFSGATLDALACVRQMRQSGIAAFATMDAGPHLKCLVRQPDVAAACERLTKVPGVLRVIVASPGEGARIVG